MNKKVLTKDLYDCQIPYLMDTFDNYTYPWEILPHIKIIINHLLEEGIEGYTFLKEDVLVGNNVKIDKTATIYGPTIIGNDVEIRPGAYIRGNVIVCDKSVVGNSCELKNAILLYHAQVPHYNYVGDSILGNYSHLGAGTICSNLKSDGKNVVIHGEKEFETNLRKVGAFIGDYADIGCGTVLNPGTIIGKHTQVYPLSNVRGVIPSSCILKKDNEIIKKIED